MGEHTYPDPWRWKKGELVMWKPRNAMGPGSLPVPEVIGVVMQYYDSNVYEAASVDVLINGSIEYMSTRDLVRLKDEEGETSE